MEQPDFVVGPLDRGVGCSDVLNQGFKRGLFPECDHQNGVRAGSAALAEVRFGAVALALYFLPARVVIDTGGITQEL